MNSTKLWAVGALFVVFSTLSQADTYGLCMGVNHYPKHMKDGKEVSNDLNGCVNDANSMRDILTTKFSVPSSNVRVVTDEAAGEQGFVDNFKWLLQTAKPGDQVVFTFSGHGARLDDPNSESGKEQVIVLADEKLVPGKLFGKLAKQFADEGVNATFVFDSCFSGGMSRDAKPEDILKVRVKSLGDLPAGMRASLASTDAVQTKSRAVDAKGQYAFLFAGKEDQPTIDVSLKDQPAHGLFTYLLLAVMADNVKTPVKDLFAVMNAALESINSKIKESDPKRDGFDQKPNFETSTPERSEKPVVIE